MKKPRALAPAAFPDRLSTGGDGWEDAAKKLRSKADSQPPNRPPVSREVYRRRRPAPLLPQDYPTLYALLRARPWLRTELVDTGLESWRRDRSRWFVWRGRKFHISRTALQFRVTDGRHRPLVQRWD